MEMPSNNPIVLLREKDGERYLPIWVGAVEATAIAYAQQGVVSPRPLTHDLLRDVLTAVGAPLAEVRITALRDGVFYALLVFESGIEVSARPSDAIALALRTDDCGALLSCAGTRFKLKHLVDRVHLKAVVVLGVREVAAFAQEELVVVAKAEGVRHIV